MQFLFTAFGLHNPFLSIPLPDHAVFPLAKEIRGELDLDYTALMIGNSFIMDAQAFDFVVSGQREFLSPMADTLIRLKTEGLLKTIDYNEIVDDKIPEIKKKVELALEDPIPWFRVVQAQWRALKDEFSSFHELYGSEENEETNTVHSGVLQYVNECGNVGREKLLTHLNGLLERKRSRYSQSDVGHIKEIVKPLIAQIFINDLIRNQVGSPFLDWDDAKGYYEKLYALSWRDNVDNLELLRQANLLFDAVIPDLKPNNIDAVIRFIRDDKAVDSMRSELNSLLEAGETISKDFFIKYSNKVVQRELALKSKMKKYRFWGAAITSLIPGGGVAQELGVAAAEEKIEDLVSDVSTSKMRWYYALQNEAYRK
ncbi:MULTISPECIES: hypothetical protein [unclassified Thalassospira]|uniref:hypothetical protein n=1 Tax=unclassified Thalassospira TaxID=2648997 RepID=UPI0007A60FAD|nr:MULTISPECIES: hypothetical protein [unclassified Thalassospira]KZC99924.1 hypothetical protein AUQ41_09725 [Thalassospira sp. MCCC 1A02898]ONH86108.1 hypothetical protein TH47_17975 [Thalassospira sp. MCCC 1A02803]